jgi:hypothetical protein
VVRRFLLEPGADTHVTTMTIEDAEHYSELQRASIIQSYQPYERDARTKGIPQLGSGRVFPIGQEQISCEPFDIPSTWPQIGGLDFGWDHPSAGVRLAWDRDNDCLYVTSAHRAREQTPVLFAASVRAWGQWLPWAWPHDGLQHDKDGTNGVEAGVSEMLDRMWTERLKVFSNLSPWFEEFNLYHRKDGQIVKLADDLLSATRYAMMMKRFATVPFKVGQKHTTTRYQPSSPPRADGLSWLDT